MLRLDRLLREKVTERPYPHVAMANALEAIHQLNEEFPSLDQFGPTIRMDGDLTAGDIGYEALLSRSSAYAALHRQVYSAQFVSAFLELFQPHIERAHGNGELLVNPFALKVLPEPVETRVSGRSFVGGEEPFLYPRFDIGYGGVGYGIQNGGRGVHVDNLPRLISILVFINTPRAMIGGSHRLYGLSRGKPVLERVYRPMAGLLIASLQSNRAFHDVEPISEIVGERRAFYIAVSCSKAIWRKEVHRKLSTLNKNRYDAPPIEALSTKLRRLLSAFR